MQYNYSLDQDGNRILPSGFNIFKDSLRKNKEELHKRMLENLPEMKLNDDEDADSASSGGSDIEILPLDFRTAMVNGKLVIQAKPKDYKSAKQNLAKLDQEKKDNDDEDELDPDKAMGNVDAYLKSVRKEAFEVTDPNVVLIDPNRKNKRSYADVMLPCEKDQMKRNIQFHPDQHDDQNPQYFTDLA